MEEFEEYQAREPKNKSSRGYQVIIILLVIVLVGLSVIYYRQSESVKREFQFERDTLIANIEHFKTEVDNVRGANEQIAYNLQQERQRADSLITVIRKERQLSNATVRKYQQEIGSLRAIMRHYVGQIDSLARINDALTRENTTIRQQATADQQRAQAAEERVTELNAQVRSGSVVKARDVKITPLNSKDREVTRISQAARLRVDFVLSANTLARTGARRIYIQIKGTDGYLLTSDVSSTFDFEGDKLTFTAFRDVEYTGEDLPVGIYYNFSTALAKGSYRVDIYMDGSRIGSGEAVFK